MGSIPGSGRSPGGGNGNPLQCPCCDNTMDRGAWRAAVYGGLKELDLSEHAHSIYKQHGSPGQSSASELSVSLSTSLQVIWKLTVTLQRVLLSEIVFSIHFLSLLEREIHRERHLSVLLHRYSLHSWYSAGAWSISGVSGALGVCGGEFLPVSSFLSWGDHSNPRSPSSTMKVMSPMQRESLRSGQERKECSPPCPVPCLEGGTFFPVTWN